MVGDTAVGVAVAIDRRKTAVVFGGDLVVVIVATCLKVC